MKNKKVKVNGQKQVMEVIRPIYRGEKESSAREKAFNRDFSVGCLPRKRNHILGKEEIKYE